MSICKVNEFKQGFFENPTGYTNHLVDNCTMKQQVEEICSKRFIAQGKVSNWDGRFFCLQQFFKNIPTELLQSIALLFLTCVAVVAALPMAVLQKSPLFGVRVLIFSGELALGLFFRPIRFLTDEARLLLGVIVHPSIAIRGVAKRASIVSTSQI